MTRRPSCPEDGTLLLHLDQELTGGERERVVAHLGSCPACRERLEALGRRADGVRGWLERHDPPPPPASSYRLPGRRRRGRAVGWAAAASIVLAGTVLAGPGPEWLARTLGSDEAPEATAVREEGADATTFSPRGATLTVSFDRSGSARRLTVSRTADSLVTLRTPGPETELLIQPFTVVVREGDSSATEYGIELPASVERLVVRVPGQSDRTIEVGAGEGSRVVEIPGG